MLTGKKLIKDIDDCQLDYGEIALWWLGQSSFVAKMGDAVIYIDPFLSPHPKRLIKPLLKPQQINHADLVLGTHDHTDHIDRKTWPTLAQASTIARFVVPELIRKRLIRDLKIPADRFVGLDDGTSAELSGVKIIGIAAAHEFLDQNPKTGQHPYLGYLIEGNGCCIYHTGDCCIYEGLITKLKPWNLDLLLVPINGRDAQRLAAGTIGNMTYQEAADLAGAIKPSLTIPTHYDMFAHNAADPQLFLDYMRVKYPKLPAQTCTHTQKIIITQPPYQTN